MTTDDNFAMTAEEDAQLAEMQAAEKAAPETEAEDTEEEAEGAVEAPEAEQTAKPKTTVPHQALHQEREERKKVQVALETERRDRAVERARFEERMAVINERLAPPEAAKPEIPDPDKDPIGALNALLKQEGERKQRDAEAQKQTTEQRQIESFTNDYRVAAREYAAKNPDFGDAYKFLAEHRINELMLTGYDEVSAQKVLHNEELGIALTAMQAGENPGERLIKLARHRGWSKKPPVAPNGAAAAELDRLEAGQKGAKSLSQAGGGVGETGMTAASLLAMSDDEFHTWTEKHPAQTKKLLGS